MTSHVTTPQRAPRGRPTCKAQKRRQAQRALDAIDRLEEWIGSVEHLVQPLGVCNKANKIALLRHHCRQLKDDLVDYEAFMGRDAKPRCSSESVSHPSTSGSPRTS